MTMDVNQRKVQLLNNNEEQTAPKAPIKRSFDVAFLMLPDDKLKQKQLRAARQIAAYERDSLAQVEEHVEGYGGPTDSEDPSDTPRVLSDLQRMHSHAKYLHSITATHKHQIFGDPNLSARSTAAAATKNGYEDELTIKVPDTTTTTKSAFTKVNVFPRERTSPTPSISPDLSYQNSLSPSPPIRHIYQNFPPNQLFPIKSQNAPSYQNTTFIQDNLHAGFAAGSSLDNSFHLKNVQSGGGSNELLPPNFPKMRPMLQYRPDLPAYAYHQFQPQDMLKLSGQSDIRHPAAAAIFTSLLPPSLAALSLPAQNVCAKCNISFRMTSDLVYHMRSHHKNDIANDLSKRRREEKLKCPVCAESFRERHHLTRHMTAHQDKEGDVIDVVDVQQQKKKGSGFAVYSSLNK